MFHSQFVGPVEIDVLRGVNGEAPVAAAVEGSLSAIDENGGLVIDSLEVEQDALAAPVVGNREGCREPKVGNVQLLDTRDTALNAGRDENLLVQGSGRKRRNLSRRLSEGRRSLVRPEAIEVLPLVASQLRARIIGPRIGTDLICPRSVERGRLELVGRRRTGWRVGGVGEWLSSNGRSSQSRQGEGRENTHLARRELSKEGMEKGNWCSRRRRRRRRKSKMRPW